MDLGDSELLVDDPMCLGEADDTIVTLPHPPDGAADGEGLVGPRHPAGGGREGLPSMVHRCTKYTEVQSTRRYKVHGGTKYTAVQSIRWYKVNGEW